jgi:hypothetical protein
MQEAFSHCRRLLEHARAGSVRDDSPLVPHPVGQAAVRRQLQQDARPQAARLLDLPHRPHDVGVVPIPAQLRGLAVHERLAPLVVRDVVGRRRAVRAQPHICALDGHRLRQARPVDRAAGARP